MELEDLKILKCLEWPTKFGFIIYAAIILILSVEASNLFKTSVLWTMTIIILPQVFHWFFWLVQRNFYYDPTILTVAFAITTEGSSENYYREIKKVFKRQIAEHRLQSRIKIKVLPSDFIFQSVADAEKFISLRGIRLLIWGDTDEGNLRNDPFTNFNLKFTYQHFSKDEESRTKFKDQIGLTVSRKSWGVHSPDSFNQLSVVSGNIVEISLFILGACFATVPEEEYFLYAIDVFENLSNMLRKRHPGDDFPNLSIVREKVREYLVFLYNSLQIYYRDKDFDKAIAYAEKAINIKENDFFAHLGMAFLQWEKGNPSLAKQHTKRAGDIRPADVLPMFSKAFLLMHEFKYEEALRMYKKISSPGDANILEIVSFLEKEFEKMPNNFGLLFAAGWLNVQYADQARGRGQLLKFLDKCDKEEGCRSLVLEVEKVLSDLNEDVKK